MRRKGFTRKRSPGRVDHSSLTSFFISNLPRDVMKSELWKLCTYLGKLTNIYIAGRKDVIGSLFAFMKFSNVERPEKIEQRLDKISCGDRKLAANLARHPCHPAPRVVPSRPAIGAPRSFPPATRDSCLFADVAKGRVNATLPPSPPPIMLSCIRDCRIGMKNPFLWEKSNVSTCSVTSPPCWYWMATMLLKQNIMAVCRLLSSSSAKKRLEFSKQTNFYGSNG